MTLKPNHIDRLSQIINDKGWDSFDYIFQDDTVENSILSFLYELSDDERDLFLDFMESYLIVQDYRIHCVELISDVVRKHGQGGVINLCPIKLKRHRSTKSGQNLIYEFDTLKRRFPGAIFRFFDDPCSRGLANAEGKLVAVDDFIGTGNQFIEMLEEIEANGGRCQFDGVAAIVVQEEAQKSINARGIQVSCVELRLKATEVVESYGRLIREEIYRVLDNLEERLLIPNCFRRGYKGTESLVTMKRTPNNTLPVFWSQVEGKDGAQWPAPFPR